MNSELTKDDFLGGRLSLWQPKTGFRAGVDAVLLAAAVPAKAGQTALELGCGVGTAMLCLATRVPGVSVHGVELQPEYADLARRNGADTTTADLRTLPAALRQQQFDHVLMNPPYFDRATGPAASDDGRDIALAGDTPLSDWLDTGIRRLAPRGHLTLIQHITRLPEVLQGVSGRLGGLVVKPIQPRATRDPGLFLLQGRRDARAPFRLASPFVLHAGDTHPGDTEHFTDAARAVLRDAAQLAL